MEPLPTASSEIPILVRVHLIILCYGICLTILGIPGWSVQQIPQPWLSLGGKTGKMLESLHVGNPATRQPEASNTVDLARILLE